MSTAAPASAPGARALGTLSFLAAVVALAACTKGYTGVTGGRNGGEVEKKPAGWKLAWSDEFEGTTLNTANWIAVDGPANVNNELQYYTPTEVYLEDGSLVLRSQRRALGGRSYTSGEVRS